MGEPDQPPSRTPALKPTYTIGALARSAGIARSTLLYYDRIGLLRPSQRSAAGYRLYGEDALARLGAIRVYRGVGIGLADIGRLLAARGRTAAILTSRLEALNGEIAALREQQRLIVRLLDNRALLGRARSLDKHRWVEILGAAGLDEDSMHRWHVEFEARAPEAHQDFLESRGIAPAEIAALRRWSQDPADAPPGPGARPRRRG
jgi:DNA-binding transcriptional MerR regulator